jgi:hypothetical protein
MLTVGEDPTDVAERADKSAEVVDRLYGHHTAGRDQARPKTTR